MSTQSHTYSSILHQNRNQDDKNTIFLKKKNKKITRKSYILNQANSEQKKLDCPNLWIQLSLSNQKILMTDFSLLVNPFQFLQ